MHIFIKNKNLFLDQYKIKCAVGKRGIKSKKREGDKCTPRGRLKLRYIFYRKDRVRKIKSKLNLIPLKKNYGWCDDVKSKLYNKFVKLPCKYKTEKLYLNNNTYDFVIVTDYNTKPIKKGKGSAIFIHVAKKNYKNTLGCIAISKINLKKIVKMINKFTIVSIS